jgi:hypothetical protein
LYRAWTGQKSCPAHVHGVAYLIRRPIEDLLLELDSDIDHPLERGRAWLRAAGEAQVPNNIVDQVQALLERHARLPSRARLDLLLQGLADLLLDLGGGHVGEPPLGLRGLLLRVRLRWLLRHHLAGAAHVRLEVCSHGEGEEEEEEEEEEGVTILHRRSDADLGAGL